MMKKMIVLSVLVLLATIPVLAQVLDFTDLDVKIGSVRVPRAFIHAGKEYSKGNYFVTLIAKEGVPYFNVSDQKKELLFEELAVLIPLGSSTNPTTVATTEKQRPRIQKPPWKHQPPKRHRSNRQRGPKKHGTG